MDLDAETGLTATSRSGSSPRIAPCPESCVRWCGTGSLSATLAAWDRPKSPALHAGESTFLTDYSRCSTSLSILLSRCHLYLVFQPLLAKSYAALTISGSCSRYPLEFLSDLLAFFILHGAEMTIYGDDPDPPPSSHLLRNTIKKFRRLHKGGESVPGTGAIGPH